MRPAFRSSTRRFCRSSPSAYLIVPRRRISIGRSATIVPPSQPGLVEALQPLLDEREEPAGVGAVDETVVVAERQVTHRPNRNRIVNDDVPLLDYTYAQNRDLWLIDERQAVERTKNARVRDGERAALNFLGVELLRTRAHGEIADGAAE